MGGDLEMWPLGHRARDPDAHATRVVIPVRENKVVKFRGEAEHRVRRHLSASGTERVSLVTEQVGGG